jgi:hypothetical protein
LLFFDSPTRVVRQMTASGAIVAISHQICFLL